MKRGRIPTVILLIGSLLFTVVMRTVADRQRESLVPRPRTASRLTGMDTFALGLVLGGLRGPLVMFLWASSENQKSYKELDDVDTKIELIRKLQPEFDSVHIFQIWNKAYNLSVQVTSLGNKYATILDAVDYGQSVDRERPDNVNILTSLGEVYGQKLGSSAEKNYYIEHVRAETLPSAAAEAAQKRRGQRNWRRTRHDVLLDERGFILPQYLESHPQPKSRELPGVEPYNAADLQYLARYNTAEAGGFKYGVSPLAIGYNYYARANILIQTREKKHLQLSDNIMDSRPAIHLKLWSAEELERARRRENTLLTGATGPEPRMSLDSITAAIPVNARYKSTGAEVASQLDEALFDYARAAMVAEDAIREYQRHVQKNSAYMATAAIYESHIDDCEATRAMARADHAYLKLIAASNGSLSLKAGELESLKRQAAAEYQKVIDINYFIILRYIVDDQIAQKAFPAIMKQHLGKVVDKFELRNTDPAIRPPLRKAIPAYLKSINSPAPDLNPDDVGENDAAAERAAARLAALGK